MEQLIFLKRITGLNHFFSLLQAQSWTHWQTQNFIVNLLS
ncbi:hypothetical protein EMIT0P2_20616 [Pseudomonas sp. IT-P2]